jgi:hypothetical protein
MDSPLTFHFPDGVAAPGNGLERRLGLIARR